MKTDKTSLLFIISALLMILLGVNDALRGIFAPLFTSVFGFSTAQVGVIVSASYLGNLTCLLFGGIILDKIGRKKAMAAFILALAISEILLLFGSAFPILIIGFFLSLGISTLLNTTINLLSDTFPPSRSLMYLSILFFLQGIGTSGSQLILTRFASSVSVWHGVLITLAVLLVPLFIAVLKMDVGSDVRTEEAEVKGNEKKNIHYVPLVLITLSLGLYTITEHGITNYIMLYGTEFLKLSAESVGLGLALYSAGIMTGRLLLSPVIEKIGAGRMVLISIAAGFVFASIVFTTDILPLLFLVGFGISIVYPTTVSLFRRYVPIKLGARVTTVAISIASILDVVFNAVFGKAIDIFGYGFSMPLLCVILALAAIIGAPALIRK